MGVIAQTHINKSAGGLFRLGVIVAFVPYVLIILALIIAYFGIIRDTLGPELSTLEHPTSSVDILLIMSAFTLPMILFALCALYFGFIFSRGVTTEFAEGKKFRFNEIFKGWLAAITRAHLLYLAASILLGFLSMTWLGLSNSPLIEKETPIWLLGAGWVLGTIYFTILWIVLNGFIWLGLTLPLSLYSAVAFRFLSLRSPRNN